jgi:hypothetical protein
VRRDSTPSAAEQGVAATPVSVVNEYFSRMRSRALSVVDLFHEDACLVGLGSQRSGRAAIREFYCDVIDRAGPSPRQAGPLLAEGSRVAAEIYIDLPNGATVHAVDLFQVEGGLIRSLTYFLASH